jgi:hypothetical protein
MPVNSLHPDYEAMLPIWTRARCHRWRTCDDSLQASDHLPVKVVFNLPYRKPFRIRSVAPTNSFVRLVWESDVGGTYNVESSTNLAVTNWTLVVSGFVATNEVSALDVLSTAMGRKFFRVVEQ